MENKAEFKAAKSLLDFMQDFASLCEKQLAFTHRCLADVVAQVMDSVAELSDTADAAKVRSDNIKVIQENRDTMALQNSEFIDTPSQSRNELELRVIAEEDGVSAESRRDMLENQLRRAGGKFSKQMEALSVMEGDVKKTLVVIMGALSMDDVISARLHNLVTALNAFNVGLTKLLENYERTMSPAVIEQFRSVVLTQVYKSYTTQEEKEIFHKIFGTPKNKVKAS